MTPSSGPTTAMPRARSVARLAAVAACSHIRTFIAGATSTGVSVASSSVVARSDARPAAMRASRSAEAGHTTTRSAERDSAMWPISLSSVSDHSVVCTVSPLSACRLSGVTNCAPPSVSTQETAQPRAVSSRISSSDL